MFIGDVPEQALSEISPLGISDFRLYNRLIVEEECQSLASMIKNSYIGASKSVLANNTENIMGNNKMYLEHLKISSRPIRPSDEKYSNGKNLIRYKFDNIHHTVVNTGTNHAYDLIVKNYTFNEAIPIVKKIV